MLQWWLSKEVTAMGTTSSMTAATAVDFASAAALSLRDLQRRVGLEGWWVLRRNDDEHVVLAAIDDVFGQGAGTVVSWEDSYCRLTVEADAPAVAPDIDAVACYAEARSRNGIPARSLVVVPLVAPNGRLIGILRALGTEVRPDLPDHLPTVRVAAAVLSVLLCHELELAELTGRADRAEGAAHTDALTGIGNRRAWDAALAAEESRCARHADQAAVIVMDLNGLKHLNDTRGHQAGDQMLIITSAILAERARAYDVVARVGGDEFAVLLPRTDVSGAWTLAGQLQRALRAAGISVSTGVAARSSRSGLAEAWHQADAAMYADKVATRQRIASRAAAVIDTAATPDSHAPDREPVLAGHEEDDAAATLFPVPGSRSSGMNGGVFPLPGLGTVDPGTVDRAVDGSAWSTGGMTAGGGAIPGSRVQHTDGAVDALLDLVRRQLGAQAGVISTFEGGRRRVRNLVSEVEVRVAVGDIQDCGGDPCFQVAIGRAPAVNADVSREPALRDLVGVAGTGIGSFAGVPLHRGDGALYGSLCVFSRYPDPGLSARDAAVLTAVTTSLMHLVKGEETRRTSHHEVLDRLDRLDATDGLQMHYQPVVDLHTDVVVGAEALARFPGTDQRPDQWFAMAASVGAGADLEMRAVRSALPALRHPAHNGFLAVNLSPQTACAPALARLLVDFPLDRLVLEITEHEEVTDYGQIRDALAPLRARGLRLAVDDTGAGYASMRHVLALVPDLIKLDISLVRGLQADPGRRALAAALTTFAIATGAQVIAEGIETAEELNCLRAIGVHFGQGYHLARPAPLPMRAAQGVIDVGF